MLKSSTNFANSFLFWSFDIVSGLILRSSTSQVWNSGAFVKMLRLVSLASFVFYKEGRQETHSSSEMMPYFPH